VAALVVTAATDGGTAVRSPVARMVRWRVAPRWYRISVGGLLDLWLLATLITVATGGSALSLEEMGMVPACRRPAFSWSGCTPCWSTGSARRPDGGASSSPICSAASARSPRSCWCR
jgi:hypothetical protein